MKITVNKDELNKMLKEVVFVMSPATEDITSTRAGFRFLDLYVTYHIPLGKKDGMVATAPILKGMQYDKDVLYGYASFNCARDREIKFVEPNFCIVTNKNMLYGASQMVDSNLMEKLLQKFGESFYVIPSSVHELVVIPSHCLTPEEAMEMQKVGVANTRNTQPDIPILTENVYFYSEHTHRMWLVDKDDLIGFFS